MAGRRFDYLNSALSSAKTVPVSLGTTILISIVAVMISYSLVLVAAGIHGAQAWGTLGHATVAYIAQNFVTSEVQTWAQGILSDTSTSYLANIASWADDYRTTTAGAWSAPLHFIDAEDNPPSNCNVDVSIIPRTSARVLGAGLLDL